MEIDLGLLSEYLLSQGITAESLFSDGERITHLNSNQPERCELEIGRFVSSETVRLATAKARRDRQALEWIDAQGESLVVVLKAIAVVIRSAIATDRAALNAIRSILIEKHGADPEAIPELKVQDMAALIGTVRQVIQSGSIP